MVRSALRLVLGAALFTALHAHAITVTFAGVVGEADGYNTLLPAVGETVTGAYTFNENAAPYLVFSSGDTYNQEYAADYSDADALGVSGSATFSGGATVNLTPGHFEYTGSLVYRNDGGFYNKFANFAETASPDDFFFNYLGFVAVDTVGTDSTLFTDPAGGLSFSQGIDTTGYNITRYGYFTGSTADGYFEGFFTPTFLSISATVPETGNLALMLGGLCLVGAAVRRQAARA